MLFDSNRTQKTFIGADPALRRGGFRVCIIRRPENTATFLRIKDLGHFQRVLMESAPTAIQVENSNLQKPVFKKNAGVAEILAVGKNMAVSEEATKIAAAYSQIPPGISPKQKGAKITNPKIFEGIRIANNLTFVGYKGTQDERDAMKLALIAEQLYTIQTRINGK